MIGVVPGRLAVDLPGQFPGQQRRGAGGYSSVHVLDALEEPLLYVSSRPSLEPVHFPWRRRVAVAQAGCKSQIRPHAPAILHIRLDVVLRKLARLATAGRQDGTRLGIREEGPVDLRDRTGQHHEGTGESGCTGCPREAVGSQSPGGITAQVRAEAVVREEPWERERVVESIVADEPDHTAELQGVLPAHPGYVIVQLVNRHPPRSGSGGKIEAVGKRTHGESWTGYPALTHAQPREPPAECINEVRPELALILHHSPAAVIEQSGSWRLSGELRLPQISLDSG